MTMRTKKKRCATYILASGKEIEHEGQGGPGLFEALRHESAVKTRYGRDLKVYGHYKQHVGQYDIEYLREGAYQPVFLISASPDKALAAIKKASKLFSNGETSANVKRVLLKD